MGGTKKAQRTKGNVKPSSSGRSAALLNTTTALPGFSGLKDSLFPSFHTSSVTEELDANIDPNFQIVLKRMNKKDPTTRVKALQEFIKLVENSDAEVLKAVLPFWSRLYCVLAGDVEHRVREVANDAQRSVVVRAKRNMAPYLRSLAGPWFIAQFDTYPPAASAAVHAFQEAFPPNKLVEAITFCQEEILKCICDNLLDETTEKLDNAERSEKQERVIITSLQSFCHYLKIVQDDLLTKEFFLQTSKTLLQSQLFWKFGIDKVPLVRSAWLSVITAILEKVPHLLKDHHQLLVKRVLGRLDETDAVVIPYVWQATLSILMRLDDWFTYCDMNKQVFPRLWNILREAGYGCASTIFPNMLPLLNSLLKSKDIPLDKEILVDSFFKSLREGIDKKSVQNSKSESDAVAQCYIECVRYVGKCGIVDIKLVQEYLLPVIEITLTEKKLSLLSRGIYEHVSYLLLYWSSDKCVSQYDVLCKYFWDKLLDLFKNVLSQTENESMKTYILSQEVQFCSSMKNPKKYKIKTIHRVRFSFEEVGSIPSIDKKDATAPSDNVLCENETHATYLKNFVMSMSLLYLQEILEHHDLCCVIPLARLLSEFNDHELIEHLISNCNVSELFTTLSKKCFVSSGQYVEIVVELACSMIHHLESAERDVILNTLCQDPDVLVCIFRAAQRENVKSYILLWLQAPYVNNQLISLSKGLHTTNELSSIKAVLMECAVKTLNGAFLVNVSTISSIMSELCGASSNAEIAVFAAQFLSNLHISFSKIDNLSTLGNIEDLSKNTYRLIVVLFCVCCDKESVWNSSKEIIFNGWQNGVNILSRIATKDVTLLVTELSSIVRQKLLSSTILSLDDVENLVEISLKILNSTAFDTFEIHSLFINGVLAEFDTLEHTLTVHCESLLILDGAPVCNLKTKQHSLTSEEICQYMLLSLFTSMIVTKIIPLNPNELEEDDEQVPVISPCKFDLMFESQDCDLEVKEVSHGLDVCGLNDNEIKQDCDVEVKEELHCLDICQSIVHEEKYDEIEHFDIVSERSMHLAIAVSLCEIYNTYFKNMQFYNNVGWLINELNKSFVTMRTALHKRGITLSCIRQSALQKSLEIGGNWVPAVYNLCTKDDLMSIQKSLSDSKHAEYSAKIFFKKSKEYLKSIPIESLGESPNIVDIIYWLEYTTITRENMVSSVIMSPISKWLDIDRRDLLYDCDVSEKPFPTVENLVKKIHFLSACISECPFVMDQRAWDFIIVSAAYYAQNLKHIQKFYFNPEEADNVVHAQSLQNEHLRKVYIFSIAVFDLLKRITDLCIRVRRKEHEEKYEFEFNDLADLANEWKDVFADDVYSILTRIFISASGHLDKEKPSFLGHVFVQHFCSVMCKVNAERIVCDDTPNKLDGTILTACCKLLHSPVSSLQFTAYHIYRKFLDHLVEKDTSTLNENQDVEDVSDQLKFEMYPLLKALQETQAVVDTMFAEFSFGDSCIIQPYTDSYYYTAAYLLLWNLILQACQLAGSELRYQYTTLLKTEQYLSSLLNNLFILMPSEVLETTLPKTRSRNLANMFTEAPDMNLNEECTSQYLQHWACWIYCCAVSRLPALVRQWWSDTKPKVSSIVQKATVQYVTPLLCMRDLQSVQNQETKWKNMEVRVHSRARQVVAVYTVDEAQMELIITLPTEYPLATIQVDSRTSSLVGTSQWRNWVKQLSIFLSHQNGSLWDGLLLWKSNLDKRFEGVEECYICFSILHGTNFQIPKLCCKTCKKKFHSPCLYKWFSTSNKSTCPICRNMF